MRPFPTLSYVVLFSFLNLFPEEKYTKCIAVNGTHYQVLISSRKCVKGVSYWNKPVGMFLKAILPTRH